MEASRNFNIFDLIGSSQREKLVGFYNCKGVELADEGKLIEALNYFNKALLIDQMCKDALFNRATIKADLGKFDEARQDFSIISTINFSVTTAKSIQITSLNHLSKINFF